LTKIGAVTIGQSPRTDVTCDILPLLGDNVQLLEAGALDGIPKEEILTYKPQEGDTVMTSYLNDGSTAVFAEKYVLPRLQASIEYLEAQGVSLIMFFCAGDFSCDFRSGVPLIFPIKILRGLIPALAGESRIAVMTPLHEQMEEGKRKWEKHVKEAIPVVASPYGPWEELEKAAYKVRKLNIDLVVLDCFGYNMKMKNMFQRITGKNTILSRTITARVVAELISK